MADKMTREEIRETVSAMQAVDDADARARGVWADAKLTSADVWDMIGDKDISRSVDNAQLRENEAINKAFEELERNPSTLLSESEYNALSESVVENEELSEEPPEPPIKVARYVRFGLHNHDFYLTEDEAQELYAKLGEALGKRRERQEYIPPPIRFDEPSPQVLPGADRYPYITCEGTK